MQLFRRDVSRNFFLDVTGLVARGFGGGFAWVRHGQVFNPRVTSPNSWTWDRARCLVGQRPDQMSTSRISWFSLNRLVMPVCRSSSKEMNEKKKQYEKDKLIMVQVWPGWAFGTVRVSYKVHAIMEVVEVGVMLYGGCTISSS